MFDLEKECQIPKCKQEEKDRPFYRSCDWSHFLKLTCQQNFRKNDHVGIPENF